MRTTMIVSTAVAAATALTVGGPRRDGRQQPDGDDGHAHRPRDADDRRDDRDRLRPAEHARADARRARRARDERDQPRRHRLEELPGRREGTRPQLRRALEGDRLALRDHAAGRSSSTARSSGERISASLSTTRWRSRRRTRPARRRPSRTSRATRRCTARSSRTATGLPTLAVQNDLLGHVLELKNQLDAYAAGNYTKSTQPVPRRVPAHVHDGRPARRRDREAEEPQ